MAELSNDTLEFLRGIEQTLEEERVAAEKEAEARRLDIQARIAQVHQAVDAIVRAVRPEAAAMQPTLVRRRTPSVRRGDDSVSYEWKDRLVGLNQRDALVAIAKVNSGKLDTEAAATIMRAAGKLQGKFEKSQSEARMRVAYLARSSGVFKEQDNRHFILAA